MGGHPGIKFGALKLDTKALSFELLTTVATDMAAATADIGRGIKDMAQARTLADEISNDQLAILDEETTHYAALPVEMAEVVSGIGLSCVSLCTSFSPPGRKELRGKLMDLFPTSGH